MISLTMRVIKIWLIIIVINYHVSSSYACSGKRIGENAGAHLRIGLQHSSSEISHAIKTSATQINTSVEAALHQLDTTSNRLLKSADRNADKLFSAIQMAKKDLERVAEKVTNSLHHGIDEIGSTLREAIHTAKDVANDLADAVKTVGENFNDVCEKINQVILELTASIDKTIDTLADTVKYVADTILEVSKNFEVRFDSGNLISLADETRQGLLATIKKLNKNWQVAINSADLKDIGRSAAAEMARGLQNIEAKIIDKVEIDDNTRQSIFYVCTSVAMVCCVFLCLFAKSCGNCISCMSTLIIKIWSVLRVMGNGCSKSDTDDGFGTEWSNGNHVTKAITIQKSKISSEESNQKFEQGLTMLDVPEYLAGNPAQTIFIQNPRVSANSVLV